MFKLFTQAKVFQNIQMLEEFLMENGLRTPSINNALDKLEELLEGTTMGKRYNEEPVAKGLSEAAKNLKAKVEVARAKREKTNEVKIKDTHPLNNTGVFVNELPAIVSYQESKGKTTTLFGRRDYIEPIVKVSATKEEKDKYCKTTGVVVALTKHFFGKKKARELINTAYKRYPRNPKAFLEGVIATKLEIEYKVDMDEFMKAITTPGINKYNVAGEEYIVEVVSE